MIHDSLKIDTDTIVSLVEELSADDVETGGGGGRSNVELTIKSKTLDNTIQTSTIPPHNALDEIKNTMGSSKALNYFLYTWTALMSVLFIFAGILIYFTEMRIRYNQYPTLFFDYSHTIIFSLFTFKFMSHKILLHCLETTSWLFARMDSKIHNRATSHFGTTLWGCFWIPINIYMLICVFRDIPRPPLQILMASGPYGYVLLQCGILDQLYDLIIRCPHKEVYVHHIGALLLGLLLLDWVPIDQKDPGLFVFCILSALDRLIHFLYGISNLMKQFELESAKTPSMSSGYIPYGFDILLPSSSNVLSFMYRVGFWYYCVFVRLLIIVIMTIYCVYQWEYMALLWKCLFPSMTLSFILIDYQGYILIYRRSLND